MKLADFVRRSSQLGVTRAMVATLIGLNLASTFFESLGIAMLLPIAELMISGGDAASLIETSRLWQVLDQMYSAVGLSIDLPILLASSFVLMLVRQFFIYARSMMTVRIQEILVFRVKNHGFELFCHADAEHLDTVPVGEVVNDLTTELRTALGCVMNMIAITNYALQSVVLIGMLVLISAPMTLAICLVAGIGLPLMRGILTRTEKTGRQLTADNQDMSSFLVERLRAHRLVRLSGTEAAELTEMSRLTKRQREGVVLITALRARTEAMIEPATIGTTLALMYVGYTAFDLALPAIGLFLVLLLRLLPIIKAGMLAWQSAVATLPSIDAIVARADDMAAAAESRRGSEPFTALGSSIELVDVAYRYPDQSSGALRGISFSIPAHRMTALVGPSGSGKSTLIDLLPRIRVPQHGKILIDGVALERFDLDSLRAGIAYAPQAPQIFNVSAEEHIRYGAGDEVDDAQVREAARLAGADAFIEALPKGYDTLLGEGGGRLSGGQRQRLDLARALVRRAPILILDEPTSNLDADAEAAFRESLKRIRRETDITLIVVGHRLSTVAMADQIVVMREGRESETGTHNQLVAAGGWYANAIRTQSLDAVIDATPVLRVAGAGED